MVIEGKHINELVFHEIFLIDVDCIYIYTPVHTRYNMPLFDTTPIKVSLKGFFFKCLNGTFRATVFFQVLEILRGVKFKELKAIGEAMV